MRSRRRHLSRSAALQSAHAPSARARPARSSQCASSPRRRLHLPLPLLHRTGSRNAPERGARALRPSRWDISPASLSSPPPTPKRPQCLGRKLVRGDYEDGVRRRVRYVDHTQVPSGPRSTQCDSRSLSSWSILHGSTKHVFDFRLCHSAYRLQVSREVNGVAYCAQIVDDEEHMSIRTTVCLDIGVDLINDCLRLDLGLCELYLNGERQLGQNEVWYDLLDRNLHATDFAIVINTLRETASDEQLFDRVLDLTLVLGYIKDGSSEIGFEEVLQPLGFLARKVSPGGKPSLQDRQISVHGFEQRLLLRHDRITRVANLVEIIDVDRGSDGHQCLHVCDHIVVFPHVVPIRPVRPKGLRIRAQRVLHGSLQRGYGEKSLPKVITSCPVHVK